MGTKQPTPSAPETLEPMTPAVIEKTGILLPERFSNCCAHV